MMPKLDHYKLIVRVYLSLSQTREHNTSFIVLTKIVPALHEEASRIN